LAQLVVSLCVIERWFHFPPHLSSATTLPWEITEQKMTNFAVSNIYYKEASTWAKWIQITTSRTRTVIQHTLNRIPT